MVEYYGVKIVHFEHGYFDETAFPFISGIREKWFKNQLAGSADHGAGPSAQDIRLSLSDDLLSWNEQSHIAPEFLHKNVLTPVQEQEKSQEEKYEYDFSKSTQNDLSLPALEPMDVAQAIRDICGSDNFCERIISGSTQSHVVHKGPIIMDSNEIINIQT